MTRGCVVLEIFLALRCPRALLARLCPDHDCQRSMCSPPVYRIPIYPMHRHHRHRHLLGRPFPPARVARFRLRRNCPSFPHLRPLPPPLVQQLQVSRPFLQREARSTAASPVAASVKCFADRHFAHRRPPPLLLRLASSLHQAALPEQLLGCLLSLRIPVSRVLSMMVPARHRLALSQAQIHPQRTIAPLKMPS